MKLSTAEMICLNSLLDGQPIPNVELYAPLLPSQQYIEKTIISLKQKGLADEGLRLTRDGEILLNALRQFKQAETYLVLNHLSLAFGQDRLCVYIRKRKADYHMFYQDRAEIYWEILNKYSWLLRPDSASGYRDSPIEYHSRTEQMKDIRQRWSLPDTALYLCKQVKEIQPIDICIGAQEEKGGCHDFLSHQYHDMTYRELRIWLWEIFELPMEAEDYAG